MDSPASKPSQRQPHCMWLTAEHPGQPQKGRTTDAKTNPRLSTVQGQPAYTSCLSDLDWHEPIPVHTNTLSACSTATQKPTQIPQSQPWTPHLTSNMTK